jgi:hypothetical protein
MAFAAPKPAYALSIEATFDPNLSASAVIVINTAISFHQTTFSDPITVNIEFENMNTGLGSEFDLRQNHALLDLSHGAGRRCDERQ